MFEADIKTDVKPVVEVAKIEELDKKLNSNKNERLKHIQEIYYS